MAPSFLNRFGYIANCIRGENLKFFATVVKYSRGYQLYKNITRGTQMKMKFVSEKN